MRATALVRRGALLAVLGVLAPVAHASAADLLDTTVSASAAKVRDCHAGYAGTASRGVAISRLTAPADGYLSARLTATTGDWDLAVFDRRSGRLVAASAASGARELAQGFVRRGVPLAVQACRRSGSARAANLTASLVAVDFSKTNRRIKMVEISTPRREDVELLSTLGLDLTEHGDATTRSAVLYTRAEENLLRAAGLDFEVEIADLQAASRADRQADAAYAAKVALSPLPSKRDGYRRLADFQSEMKALAAAHPTLVKTLTLPNKTLEGRDVEGIEITPDVNAKDGKPVFLMTGVHHAREWPSAENPMEFAVELANGYGTDARITRLLDAARVIVVPIMNVDGYNLSREAPDEGTLFEYKRKNCRVVDGAHPPVPGVCAQMPDVSGTGSGVDPNRNYGGDWGGPGASTLFADATYRGAAPFSEPEVDNVRKLISARQVTTFITNHTHGGLILRPPGISALGTTKEEPLYKTLGDSMAAHNKYTSQYSWQLYDTSGTAEAWSYYATGGLGFTFEIHKGNFHEAYASAVVKEYLGKTVNGGLTGNRGAYFTALESTVNEARHSVIEGTATPGATLTLSRSFTTTTSRVQPAAPLVPWGDPIAFPDNLTSTLVVPEDGAFEWHVNPSTRPDVYGGRAPTGPTTADFGYAVAPGTPNGAVIDNREFTVAPGEDNAVVKVRASWVSANAEDWTLDLFKKEADGKLTLMARSAIANRSYEEVESVHAVPGTYVIRTTKVRGAAASADVAVDFVPPAPAEAWKLTCTSATGTVARDVFVNRGEGVDLGALC